ncbi:MAG: HAD family phosphatase [Actinomycetota bacterium]|nr:HAD family phosphatase [Actinomycetota bacterium]
MIRAVVCDLGGVLTSPLAGSFERFQEHARLAPEALGRALTAITQAEGANPLHELECGRMSEQAFMNRMAAALREEVGRDVPMHEFTERYWAGLRPNAAMVELMSALRAEGYRMALLTNNVREWEPRWRALLPVDDIFELVIDSAFVGMRKPDPEIYALTVRRLSVPAAQCLFVDDLEPNCAAARSAGMSSVHFVETEQAIADIRAALRAAGA